MTGYIWYYDMSDKEGIAAIDAVDGAALCDWFEAKARELGLTPESEEAA